MRWLVMLVLTAALVGAAVWLLLGGEGRAREDDADGERTSLAAGGGPALEGHRRVGASPLPGARTGRCTLQGRVTRGGTPARATVEAHLAPGRSWGYRPGSVRAFYEGRLRTPAAAGTVAAAARSTCDADGRFVLEGLGVGEYDVVARDGEGARAHRLVDLGADGTRASVDLVLEAPGLVLRGRVHFTDGRPVAGRVAAWAPLAGNLDSWEVTPGAGMAEAAIGPNGSFTLGGLVPGRHVVRVFLPDGGVALGPLVRLPSAESYDVLVPHLPIAMRGRVLAEPGSEPVAGAWVLHLQYGEVGACAAIHRAVTDADGRFSLPGPEGPADLKVDAPGHGSRWVRVQRTADEIVVHLPRAARVEGRVLAKDDGRPVAGARVLAAGGDEDPMLDETRTDADGRYVLADIPPGQRQLFVLGGGWSSPGLGAEEEGRLTRLLTVDVPAGGRVAHDLLAERSVRLEGAALSADGRPVAGASVEVSAVMVHSEDAWLLREALPARRVASAPDGSFVFEDLPPGAACRLAAWASGEAPVLLEPTPIAAPGPVRVEVRFPRPSLLDVRVVAEEDGSPIAGALVSARLEGVPDETDVPAAAVTGEDGRAQVGPVGGEGVSVTASLGETTATLDPEEVTAGASGGARHLELRLPRGLTLRGVVQRADGSPAPGATVRARSVEADDSRNIDGAAGFDGAFRLEGLRAGRWIVTGHRDDVDTEPLAVDAGADGVVLRLPEPPPKALQRTLRLLVLDAQGRPVPAFRVTVRQSDGQERFEGLEGRAELVSEGALARDEGPGVAEVYDARGGDGQPLDLAPQRLTDLPRGDGDVEVRLATGRSIAGRVLRPDGSPAVGVRVWAHPVAPASEGREGPVPFEHISAGARCDAAGRFRLLGVAEARYRVTVEPPPGCAALSPPPEVGAGARDLELRLRAAVSPRVRVLAWDGRAVAGAQVWTMVDEEWESHETDAEGRTVLDDLDPEATVLLQVDPPDDLEEAVQLTLSPWRPTDGDLRLERGRTVAGVVRDPTGLPVEGVYVSLADSDGDEASEGVTTDAIGAFRFSRLPPGKVRLRAYPPRVGRAKGGRAEAVVEVGRENVVLTVDPGHVVRVRLSGQAAQGDPLKASVLFTTPEGKAARHEVRESSQRGLFVLAGLDPETPYAFWVALEGSRYAYAEFDRSASEVVAPVREGRSIRGRIVGFPLGEQVWVYGVSTHGVQAQAQTNREGRYELRGLPPGLWKVHTSVDHGGVQGSAAGEAEAGGTLDLVLQAGAER